jgi:plastocyanin
LSIRRCLLVALALVSVSMTVFGASNIMTITQQGRAFSSGTVQIVRGETVRFSNVDKFIHQVYVESPSFNYESDEQAPGNDVDVAFLKTGTFEVRCHIHPKMLLHVDVR